MDYLIISRSNMRLGIILFVIGASMLLVLIEDEFSVCSFDVSMFNKECWING